MDKISKTRLLAPSAFTAFLLALAFTLYIPLVSYYNNINEFSFEVGPLILSLAPFFLAIFGGAFLFFLTGQFIKVIFKGLKPNNIPQVNLIHIVAITVIFCTWLEGALLSRNLPPLTGETNLFPASSPRMAVDSLIWLGALVFSLALWKHLAEKFWPISLAVLLFLILGVADSALSRPQRLTAPVTRAEALNQARFSPLNNVLILVLDATSTAVVQNYFQANPGRQKEFDGFTIFENNLETAVSTQWALPSMLKGDVYTGGPVDEYQNALKADDTLTEHFSRRGYDIYVSSTLPLFNAIKRNGQNLELAASGSITMTPRLYGQLYIRFAPYLFKNPLADGLGHETAPAGRILAGGNLASFPVGDAPSQDAVAYGALITAIGRKDSPNPTFHFHHLNGSHKPYEINRQGGHLPGADRYSLAGLYQQSAWTLDSVLELFKALKDNGLYDSATIALLGDHGDRMEDPGRPNNAYATQPTLIIKPSGQRGAPIISPAPTSNMYLATIIPRLHLEGKSLAQLTENLPPTRQIFWSDDSMVRTYEGREPGALREINSFYAQQKYQATTLKPNVNYTFNIFSQNRNTAYPLPGQNIDFSLGWGVTLTDIDGRMSFKTERSGPTDVEITIETSHQEGGYVAFDPYTLTLTDQNSGRQYTLEIDQPFYTRTLPNAQVTQSNTLDLNYSLSSPNSDLTIRLVEIELRPID